jgi:H+/Cl- antiporter ClcA
MSLALVKRYEEGLHLFRKQGLKENKSRGYNYTDLSILSMIGVACGCISTLIFMMYITFSTAQMNYKSPGLLWIIGTLLFYWISKIWIKATRGEIKEDPLSYSLKDPESLIVFLLMAILFFAAIYL